jgi:nicotinamide-nucleotide amidase
MELFNKKILEATGKQLLKRKETIAVAESVTAGLFQFAFSTIPDAASFFQGGITAYNIGQKFKHLRVEPLHALSVNCVSQQVATQMAMHVCELYASDWGIGTTGYASPDPKAGNKLFAFYAITYKGKVKASGKITQRKADPPEIQVKYVDEIFRKLLTAIKSSG